MNLFVFDLDEEITYPCFFTGIDNLLFTNNVSRGHIIFVQKF